MWLYVVNHGYMWLTMVICGYIWLSIVILGYIQWQRIWGAGLWPPSSESRGGGGGLF